MESRAERSTQTPEHYERDRNANEDVNVRLEWFQQHLYDRPEVGQFDDFHLIPLTDPLLNDAAEATRAPEAQNDENHGIHVSKDCTGISKHASQGYTRKHSAYLWANS